MTTQQTPMARLDAVLEELGSFRLKDFDNLTGEQWADIDARLDEITHRIKVLRVMVDREFKSEPSE